MRNKNLYFFLILLIFLNSCSGTSSKGLFGTGVSVAIDPRSLGLGKKFTTASKSGCTPLFLKADPVNTGTKFGIRGIPTMLLFKAGELKATKVGATTKSNIVSWIKENI